MSQKRAELAVQSGCVFGVPPYEMAELPGMVVAIPQGDHSYQQTQSEPLPCTIPDLPPLVAFVGPAEQPTQIEGKILSRMSFGLTLPAIARQLFTSLSTINRHSRSLYGKLGARNMAHAVRLGFYHDFLQVRPDEFSARPVPDLSSLERFELELAARGLSCQEAAAFRGVTKDTTETHRRNIISSFGVAVMAHAVRRACSADMLSSGPAPHVPLTLYGCPDGVIRQPK